MSTTTPCGRPGSRRSSVERLRNHDIPLRRGGWSSEARPGGAKRGKPARAADENPLISCFAPLRDALAIGKLRVRHRVESSDCGIAVSAPYRRTSPCSMRLFRSSSRTHLGLSFLDSPTEALEKTRV